MEIKINLKDKRIYTQKLKKCKNKEEAFKLGYNMALILNGVILK